MTIYDQIATKIIKEQELLMGPVAWYQANKVTGLHIIDQKIGTVHIEDNLDNRVVIDNLVNKYADLFGRVAREVCKETVTALIAELPKSEVPSSLQ
jgi:hypothetical protein